MYSQFDTGEIPATDIAAKSIQTHSPAQRHLRKQFIYIDTHISNVVYIIDIQLCPQ